MEYRSDFSITFFNNVIIISSSNRYSLIQIGRKMKRMKTKTVFLFALLITSLVYAVSTVRAVKNYESYIVVNLKSVMIIEDNDVVTWPLGPDDNGYGELELATFVYAEGIKETQTTVWPRKDQGSSWHEVNTPPVDQVNVNMPIFVEKEEKVGDEIVIVITALDNDETAEWFDKFMDSVIKISPSITKLLGTPGWVGSAINLGKFAYKLMDEIIPDSTTYGVYSQIHLKSEWESGSLEITERARPVTTKLGLLAADLYVTYEIRRIQVPVRTPPLAVKLNSVTASHWATQDLSDGTEGEVFIKTRVFDDVGIKAQLTQMYEYGTRETGGTFDLAPDEIWTPPDMMDGWPSTDILYQTDSIGPILYIEISVWDKDIDTNNDLVGLYSGVFWPDGNWGIGQTISADILPPNLGRQLCQSIADGNDEYVTIEFEIVELPFAGVAVDILTSNADVYVDTTRIYAVEIENLGTETETFDLTVDGLDSLWYDWPGGNSVSLLAGGTQVVTLAVTPPRHYSTTPETHAFTVTAKSSTDSTISDSDSSAITVIPFYDVEVFMPTNSYSIKAGTSATYTIGVQNTGNSRMNYNLSVESTDFDVSLATLWPEILWDLDSGETGSAFLQISVPLTWADESTYDFIVTAGDTEGLGIEDFEAGSFSTTVLELGEGGITLELTEGIDYLFREDIKIKIAGLVTDNLLGEPISGSTVTFEIYDPAGDLWESSSMTEVDAGIHEWESEETLLKTMQNSWKGPKTIKGVYLVHATAQFNGQSAHDIIEFHIDPPTIGSENYLAQLPLVLTAATLALGLAVLLKRANKRNK